MRIFCPVRGISHKREHADMGFAHKCGIALAALVSTALVSILRAAEGGPNGAYPDRGYYPSIGQGL